MNGRRRAPLGITLLLGLVLIITVLSVVRLLTAIWWRSALASYLSIPLVLYVGLSGAAWTLAGCFVLWCMWRRARYSRQIVLIAAGSYAAWGWADRLLVQSGAGANWLFALVGTVILLAFVAIVVLDPRNLPYFRKESHDRKSENPISA